MINPERPRRDTRPLTEEEKIFHRDLRRRLIEQMKHAGVKESEVRRLHNNSGCLRPDGTVSHSSPIRESLTWELLYKRMCGIWRTPRYKSAASMANHYAPGADGRIDILELAELAEALDAPADMLLPTRRRDEYDGRYFKALASLRRRHDEDIDHWRNRVELVIEFSELDEYAAERGLAAAAIAEMRNEQFELKLRLGEWPSKAHTLSPQQRRAEPPAGGAN